ncbi:MAG: SH3 domain-containing protein [Thermoplasmataceae archaeon]
MVIKTAKRVHHRTYDFSITVLKGEKVHIIKREIDYPGWVWCANKAGTCAWVPESILNISENIGCLLEDYCSLELNVELEEKLEIVREHSGWIYCINSKGERGYVPKNIFSGEHLHNDYKLAY